MNGKSGKFDGKFLVRPKGKALVLSVMYRGKVTHHAIEKGAAGTYKINGKDSKQKTVPNLLKLLEQKQDSLKWPVPLKPTMSVVSPEAQQAKDQGTRAAAADVGAIAGPDDDSVRGIIDADAVDVQLSKERNRLASLVKAPYNPMGGVVETVKPRNKQEAIAARNTAVQSVDAQRYRANQDNKGWAAEKSQHTGWIQKEAPSAVRSVETHPDDKILPLLAVNGAGRTDALKERITEDRSIVAPGDVAPPPKAKLQDAFGDLTAEEPLGRIEPPKRQLQDDASNGGGAADDVTTLPFVFQFAKASEATTVLEEGNGLEDSGKFLCWYKPTTEDPGAALVLSVVFRNRVTHHQITRGAGAAEYSVNGSPTPCTTILEVTKFLSKKRKAIKWPVPLTNYVAND